MTTLLAVPSVADPRATTPGPFLTVPNAVTLIRTLTAIVLGIHAIHEQSATLLIAGYACYWLGDMLDGWCARWLGQETRAGAVFDIICDRACTSIACCAVVVLLPEAALVAIAFLVSFMVLDMMLSLAFLCWPLLSPNYFYRVDHRIWLLNWSPVAKAVNTAGVIGAIALHQYPLGLGLTLLVAGVKVWSLLRVARLLETPR